MLFEDVDELLEEKSISTSTTKTVGMKITEFLKKIEEKKSVESPRFKLDGSEFYIWVKLSEENPEFIGVFLVNVSKKDQTTSFTFLEGSGARESLKMKEIKRFKANGFVKFLSLEKFKTWAFIHGDVFSLKATVTLHQKGSGDDWIRYCSPAPCARPVSWCKCYPYLRSKQKLEVPKSLGCEATILAVNKTIMQDEETADFSVRCQTKSFKVHKNFLCSRLVEVGNSFDHFIVFHSRSPVLRAMILGSMKEAQKNEVFIEDLDAETLAIMISYIYTGDFEVGDSTDLQMVARAADKYDIRGLMDFLCFKMKTGNIKNYFIADMLITADRHKSRELRAVALDKLRADRSIMKEAGFRQRMMMAENKNLIFDLVNDL